MNKKEALDKLFSEMYSLKANETILTEDTPATEEIINPHKIQEVSYDLFEGDKVEKHTSVNNIEKKIETQVEEVEEKVVKVEDEKPSILQGQPDIIDVIEELNASPKVVSDRPSYDMFEGDKVDRHCNTFENKSSVENQHIKSEIENLYEEKIDEEMCKENLPYDAMGDFSEVISQDVEVTEEVKKDIEEEINNALDEVLNPIEEDLVFEETKEEEVENTFINNIIKETEVGKDNFDRLIEDQQIELGFKTTYSDKKESDDIETIKPEKIIESTLSPEQEEIASEFEKYEEEIKKEREEIVSETEDNINEDSEEKDEVRELSEEEEKRLKRTNTALNLAIGALSALALFLSYKTFI